MKETFELTSKMNFRPFHMTVQGSVWRNRVHKSTHERSNGSKGKGHSVYDRLPPEPSGRWILDGRDRAIEVREERTDTGQDEDLDLYRSC